MKQNEEGIGKGRETERQRCRDRGRDRGRDVERGIETDRKDRYRDSKPRRCRCS